MSHRELGNDIIVIGGDVLDDEASKGVIVRPPDPAVPDLYTRVGRHQGPVEPGVEACSAGEDFKPSTPFRPVRRSQV